VLLEREKKGTGKRIKKGAFFLTLLARKNGRKVIFSSYTEKKNLGKKTVESAQRRRVTSSTYNPWQ